MNLFHKKEKKEEDPNQLNFNAIQNMIYIMKGTFQYQKLLIPLLFIVIITTSFLDYLPSIIIKVILQRLQQHVTVKELCMTALYLGGFSILVMLVNNYTNSHIWWRMFDCRIKFMMRRIHKVLHMDYEYLESSKVMDVCQKAFRATGGNNNGVEGMMHSFQNIMVMIVKILFAVTVLGMLNPWLVVLNLFLGILVFINMDVTSKINKEKTWDAMAPFWKKDYYMENMSTNFSYAKDIRLFSMKDWMIHKYEKIHAIMHKKAAESEDRWKFSNILGSTFFLVLNIIIYAYVAYCVVKKDMTIDDYSFYIGTATTFYLTMFSAFGSLAQLRNQSREINDFRTFLEYPEREQPKETLPLPKTDTYEFVFEHVYFQYDGAKSYALDDLNLTLKAGERLAVVGLNGAGKTTLIKLLCRLYAPTKGRILLNGVDIQSFDRYEYFKLFAPVFQEVEIFAFPMEENVSMKPPKETDSNRAEEFLRKAGLGDKLDTLEKGVKTELLKVIDEDGIDLSGGERQKLAFARALYKNSPIVVLDEPTSALDALAEYQMYQSFERLIGHKTAIFISHRLSSTRFCDNIAMFEGGKLVEYGKHEELLAKGGSYAKMYQVQAQYYQEGGAVNDTLHEGGEVHEG